MSSGQFITDAVVVTGKDKCPPGYSIVSTFCIKNYVICVSIKFNPGWNLCTPRRRSSARSLKILGVVA